MKWLFLILFISACEEPKDYHIAKGCPFIIESATEEQCAAPEDYCHCDRCIRGYEQFCNNKGG